MGKALLGCRKQLPAVSRGGLDRMKKKTKGKRNIGKETRSLSILCLLTALQEEARTTLGADILCFNCVYGFTGCACDAYKYLGNRNEYV